MTAVKRHPTRAFDCWGLAKELRMDIFRKCQQKASGENNWLVSSGGTEGLLALPAGLGKDHVHLGGENYGAGIAGMGLSEEYMSACEKKGYARDICGYCRSYMGSVFADKYPFGGPYPHPDFYFQLHICDTHSAWYKNCQEYLGGDIPIHIIDFGTMYRWPKWGETEKRKQNKLDYVTQQELEAIDWMEKITGREYNDELLGQAVYNEVMSTSRWAQCCELNKAIPAPMEIKSMYAFYIIHVMRRHTNEAREFYDILYDELEDRIANGIAGVEYERYRMIHNSQPPWHALDIFRYLEKYGVACVGSQYDFTLSGGWDYYWDENDMPRMRAALPPADLKDRVSTREGACRMLAEWMLLYGLQMRSLRLPMIDRRYVDVAVARDWNCQAAMMHLNRGCEGWAVGQLECRLALVEAGFPVLTYEGNVADPREYDRPKTYARIDAFLEANKLGKLMP